ncbi:unnamed protein product [Withania somnifera]
MTEFLIEYGRTYEFKGPIFANVDMFFTCDPANIHHIFSKNFSNYPKGPEFRKIFDILENGIFNVDDELWELHRKTTKSIMCHAKFQILLERTTWDTIEKRLGPILDAFAKQGKILDLQDVLQRFTFDSITKLLLDHDPRSLSIDLPYLPYEKTFGGAVDALLHTHCYIVRKKLIQPGELLRKQEELMHKSIIKDEEFTFLNGYIKMDTTSVALTWFFLLLAKNPLVEKKIREEIQHQLHHKVPLDHDVLPSGHRVSPETRMITLWVKDCLELKPERRISKRGGIKHVPSYKFPAFNPGPRNCLGKEMAFIQMKIVAATLIHNYNIQVVEPENVTPATSIIMQVKNGFMVNVVKRV